MEPGAPDLFAEPVQTLWQSLLPPTTTSLSVTSASPMTQPALFSGAAEDCSGFLLQCPLQFEMQAPRFLTDKAKITYIISLLPMQVSWTKSPESRPPKDRVFLQILEFRWQFMGLKPDKTIHSCSPMNLSLPARNITAAILTLNSISHNNSTS